MDAPDTDILLVNRSFLYALAARGFAEEPDEAFFGVLASDHARTQAALADGGKGVLASCFAGVLEAADDYGAVGAVREYVRLFIGPQALQVAPYESAFLSGGRALFQPGSLLVRDAYRAAGFLPAQCGHVPDDFIGTELDFMAKLAQTAVEAFGRRERAERLSALEASLDFLEGHLLKWIAPFAEALEKECGDCFYSRFAKLSALISENDARVLAEMHQPS